MNKFKVGAMIKGKFTGNIYEIYEITYLYKCKLIYNNTRDKTAKHVEVHYTDALPVSLEEHLELIKSGITFKGE